jgi:hypothetical protein
VKLQHLPANVQYFEGGSLIPNKSPGRLTFSDVTLERGATEDRDLFGDWLQHVAITSSGLGLTDVNYKRNLDIVQQDRDTTRCAAGRSRARGPRRSSLLPRAPAKVPARPRHLFQRPAPRRCSAPGH